MAYSIEYYDLKGQTASEPWTGRFEAAKNHARNAVETGCATRAEVRDASGALIFHYPRILHAQK